MHTPVLHILPLIFTLLLLLLPATSSQSNAQHQSSINPIFIKLDATNFQSERESCDLLLVLFSVIPSEVPEEYRAQLTAWKKLSEKAEYAIERAAELMGTLPIHVKYGMVDMFKDYVFAQKNLGMTEVCSIVAYRKDAETIFHGHRSREAIARFIAVLVAPAVVKIETKEAKRSFEDYEWPKMVGFFSSEETHEYKVYVNAAQHFQGAIKAYAIFDASIAKLFMFKLSGTAVLIKPYDKNFLFSIETEMQADDLVTLLSDNRRQALTQVSKDNAHEAWQSNENSLVLLLSFLRPSTSKGAELLSLLQIVSKKLSEQSLYEIVVSSSVSPKNIAPEIVTKLRSQRPRFIWVDPDKFPETRSEWMKQYGLTNTDMDGSFGLQLYRKPSIWISSTAPKSQKTMERWVKDKLAENLINLISSLSSKPNAHSSHKDL